jgi:hypothetical protein
MFWCAMGFVPTFIILYMLILGVCEHSVYTKFVLLRLTSLPPARTHYTVKDDVPELAGICSLA